MILVVAAILLLEKFFIYPSFSLDALPQLFAGL
jgi:hypothetical protein